ncbi:hypothetical protein JOD54_005921 [Actinokineospora baliensis]|uniref:hypothetical protein n=1 Tax=Actinokineospora baliensis TaxID=547056 RepID=UPI00195A24F1|nr:hypothetical protein [Actinokineospora baliensis]MBM7775717.1 hypothetical protein [Actinokineospora baliensis]
MGRPGRLAALAVGVLALVSGCTQVVAPPPHRAKPVPNYKPAPVDVKKILGDLPTLDPCSLIDPADFGGGKIIGSGSWDECPLTLPTGTGQVTVTVGAIDKVEAFAAVSTPEEKDGFTTSVYSSPMAPCGRLLHLGDGTALSVHVLRPGEGSGTVVCPQIATGFDKMLQRLRKNPKVVKHSTFAPGSMAALDPCVVIPPAAVAAFPTRKSWPAKHTCEWSDSAQSTARVIFGLTSPSLHTPFPMITVAGRQTEKFDIPSGNDSICILSTNGRPAGRTDGQVESASLALTLRGTRDTAATCAQAVQMAEQMWPVVPPA